MGQTVGMLLEPELLQEVQEGAAVHGATVLFGYVKPCVRSPLKIFQLAGVRRLPRVAGRCLMTHVSTAPASCCAPMMRPESS